MTRRGPGGLPGAPQRIREAVDRARSALGAGHYQAAESILEPALRLAPRDAELLHLLGATHLATGRVDSSIRLLRKAVKAAPKVAHYAYNLGNALVEAGRHAEALKAFRSAIRLDRGMAEAHANAGLILIQLRRFEEAIEAFRQALRIAPQAPHHHINLALAQYQSGSQRDAVRTIEHARNSVSALNEGFWVEAARLLRDMLRFEKAESAAREALALAPSLADAWVALAEALEGLHQTDEAIEAYNTATEHGFPASMRAVRIAELLSNAGLKTRALAQVAENVKHYPSDESILFSSARVLLWSGEYEQQEALLQRLLKINPNHVAALNLLLSVPGRQLDAEYIGHLASLLTDETHPTELRSKLGFALGSYFHEHGEYDRAFESYDLGNRLRDLHYNRPAVERWTKVTIDTFDRAFIAERLEWGMTTRQPLLIVGMPRSGTTLIEQIVSAHSRVTGAGELGAVPDLAATPETDLAAARENPADLERLDAAQVQRHAAQYLAQLEAVAPAGQAHVSNKYPANFRYLGLFALLFPKAPIVHLQRDPRDTLLSIYFHDFAGAHDYAYDLKALGHYYLIYEQLMAHWRTLLPNPLLEIRYEDVVDDLPAAARQLAQFLDLEWDDAMLSFHQQEREVRTASHWQVRQPIYRSALGRWRHYERQLAPLLKEIEKARRQT